MSSNRLGGGSGSGAMPANARKIVQSLKEIVSNSEDEIYSVLKECNMDPNETVQKLLNQDPFHEVRRKRDKKKEWNRESTDVKVRPGSGGTQMRGGRSGPLDRASSRGGSLTRHESDEFNGRGKSYTIKENGVVNSISRSSNSLGGPLLSAIPSFGQGKTSISGLSHPVPATPIGTSPGLQNGNPVFARPASLPQGSWSASIAGHATMADILKANGSLSQPGAAPAMSPSTAAMGVPVATSVAQQYIISSTSPLPVSSSVYSSSINPVLPPPLNTHARVGSATYKRDASSVGSQWSKHEWPSPPLAIDSLLVSSITSQPMQTVQTNTSTSTDANLERDAQFTNPTSPQNVSLPILQDHSVCGSVTVETVSSVGTYVRHAVGICTSGSSGSRTTVVCSPFNSRTVYSSQQHPVGTQKAMGPSVEWKPKLALPVVGSIATIRSPSPSSAGRPSTPTSMSLDSGISTKLQGINMHDDQPVIIPNHLQVAEAEQSHLSFGSFTAGFGSSLSSEDDTKETAISTADGIPVIEAPIEQSTTPSAVSTASVNLDQSYTHQPVSSPEQMSASSSEMIVASMPPPVVVQHDLAKPDPVVHQGPYYPYLPALPNYPGFNIVHQVPGSQFTYESTETQPSEVARMPSLMQAYTEPAASYYTPTLRQSSDGDGRYPSFITNSTSNKYNGNMGLVNLSGQSLPSQESGNSVLPPVPAVQTSQTGSGQTIPTMAQQPLPLHAYAGQPAGAQLGHHFTNVFGYQYMPPSYAYMHTHPPYQHNYTASSVYPQLPAPAAASSYSTGGAATVKYQLPQYKPGNGTGIASHAAAAVGYGGYSSGVSGYSVNPTVSAGNAACYEDIPQYKDNLYIPSQQVEGSTVWIQAQLSRDMTAGGMQASSYYNLPGQGQHTSYAHAQQPTHTHAHPASYANLYHPSQPGQATAAHQLLQQPQTLSTGGGSQGGAYHQPQRAQQLWTNTY